MTGFTVERVTPVDLERTSPLSGMFVLSPCVWREDDTYKLLVRAVNPSEDASQKVARIYYGERTAVRIRHSSALTGVTTSITRGGTRRKRSVS